jgi:hypothetical protein
MMEVIDRKMALALGLKRYFTGRACSNGHIEERSVSSKNCVLCSKSRDNNRNRIYCDSEREKRRIRANKRKNARIIEFGNSIYTKGNICRFCGSAIKYVKTYTCVKCCRNKAFEKYYEKRDELIQRGVRRRAAVIALQELGIEL